MAIAHTEINLCRPYDMEEFRVNDTALLKLSAYTKLFTVGLWQS